MINILFNVAPIFFLIIAGMIVKNKFITTNDFWNGLEKLSYFFLFPALLFRYTAIADFSSGDLNYLIISIMLSTVIISLMMFFLKKKLDIENKIFTSLFQGSIRYNSYLLFGLGGSMFARDNLTLVGVISAYMMIVTNILTVITFNICTRKAEEIDYFLVAKDTFLKFIYNPLINSSIIGLIFNHMDVGLHPVINKTLGILSDAALGIGILTVGASLKIEIHSIQVKMIALCCSMKLIIMPVITGIIMTIFKINENAYQIGIMYSALPCATSAAILSKQLGGDERSMATIITISNVLSILTLSLMLSILT